MRSQRGLCCIGEDLGAAIRRKDKPFVQLAAWTWRSRIKSRDEDETSIVETGCKVCFEVFIATEARSNDGKDYGQRELNSPFSKLCPSVCRRKMEY